MLTWGCTWSRLTFFTCWSCSVPCTGAKHNPEDLLVFFSQGAVATSWHWPKPATNALWPTSVADECHDWLRWMWDMQQGGMGGCGCVGISFEAFTSVQCSKFCYMGFLIKVPHPLCTNSGRGSSNLCSFLLHLFSKVNKDTNSCPYWASHFGNTLWSPQPLGRIAVAQPWQTSRLNSKSF